MHTYLSYSCSIVDTICPQEAFFYARLSTTRVYMFAWNTLTYDSNYLFTELRVENEVKGTGGSKGASGQYIPGSTSILCHVRKGYHVWVQTSGSSNKNYMYNWRESTSFMGFLLQKD